MSLRNDELDTFSCPTGTLQNHARKYNLPIDELNFRFKVIPVYRDQAVIAEALKNLGLDAELEQDQKVSSGLNPVAFNVLI